MLRESAWADPREGRPSMQSTLLLDVSANLAEAQRH